MLEAHCQCKLAPNAKIALRKKILEVTSDAKDRTEESAVLQKDLCAVSGDPIAQHCAIVV